MISYAQKMQDAQVKKSLKQTILSQLHYDFIMIVLSLESPSGCETSSEERDVTLL